MNMPVCQFPLMSYCFLCFQNGSVIPLISLWLVLFVMWYKVKGFKFTFSILNRMPGLAFTISHVCSVPIQTHEFLTHVRWIILKNTHYRLILHILYGYWYTDILDGWWWISMSVEENMEFPQYKNCLDLLLCTKHNSFMSLNLMQTHTFPAKPSCCQQVGNWPMHATCLNACDSDFSTAGHVVKCVRITCWIFVHTHL